MCEFKTLTVTSTSVSEYYGPHHLDELLAGGWEIIRVADGVTVSVCGENTLTRRDVVGSLFVLRRDKAK